MCRFCVFFSKIKTPGSMKQVLFFKVFHLLSLFSVACSYKQNIVPAKTVNNCQCKYFYQNEELHINCSYKDLEVVPSTPSDTVYLYLQHNFIKRIPNKIFDNLEMLVLLDLSFNRILKLYEDSLAGLHNLRFLDLNGNLQQRYCSSLTLPRNVFKHLVNLTLLDLSHNNIRSIHQYTFNGLVDLQHLKFNSNELGKIPNGTFQYTQNLVILELVHNSIYNVTKEMFTGLGNLHHLYLNGNYMRSIHNNAFLSLINLTELNLSFNLLHSANRKMFAGLSKLRHLYLGFNDINKISNQTFENLTDLRLLDLSNNVLQSLNEKIFIGLKNLEVLRLNNNKLRYTTEWLPPGCFKALESLRQLSIQMNNPRNEIDTFILPDETIKDLKMLENLALDVNVNDERFLGIDFLP